MIARRDVALVEHRCYCVGERYSCIFRPYNYRLPNLGCPFETKAQAGLTY
jgi:hypothetical protein